MPRWIAAVCLTLALSLTASPRAMAAQPVGVVDGLRRYGPLVELVLDNGDRVKGIYSETVEGKAMIDHPVLGQIGIPIHRITEVRPVGGVSLPQAEPAPVVAEAPAAEAPAAAQAEELDPDAHRSIFDRLRADGWKSELVLGIDGSKGNTEEFDFSGSFLAQREVEGSRLTFETLYDFEEADGEEVENSFEQKVRHDWLFEDSPWEWFAKGDVKLDKFEDYDLRWSAATGPGYKFIDTDRTFLIGRAGPSVSQEIGSDDEDLIFEVFFGYELTHKLNDRWGLATSGEIYPSVSDGGEFRSEVRGSVDYKLSTETDFRLRAGVEWDHDSQVDPGTDKDDLDYFISLVLGF